MKFGILYNIDYRPEVHGSSSSYYAQILDQIQLLEELGFDSAWFGEHHYAGYSFGAPAVIATAAAARTRRLRLGTGVSLIPLHYPLRLAEEYAMLDVLSNGRLEYGIGRGFLNYAYQVMGVDRAQSFERFREGTELIIQAWTAAKPFLSRENSGSSTTTSYSFSRLYKNPTPRIYASGTMSQESYIFAGSRGLHLCTAFFIPDKEAVRTNIALYRKTLADHGYDPSRRDVAGVFPMYCGESKAQSLRYGGECTLNYFKFFGSLERGTAPSTAGGFGDRSIEFYDDQRLVLLDDPVWNVTVFTKNRERLLVGEVAQGFFNAVVEQASTRGLLSNEHFTVDGTLIEAWAGHKSFKRKGDDQPTPPEDPGNPSVDFHGERRSNATHQSTTDPEARLARKGPGKEVRLVTRVTCIWTTATAWWSTLA
jgi:alkanesulfonate monooxygenase SsuD/methylene tetrahydromethanopterin reductase-like flavin-dependent oxidoreductase (luciferase family)